MTIISATSLTLNLVWPEVFPCAPGLLLPALRLVRNLPEVISSPGNRHKDGLSASIAVLAKRCRSGTQTFAGR